MIIDLEYLENVIDEEYAFIQAIEINHYEHPNTRFPYKQYFETKGKVEFAEHLIKEYKIQQKMLEDPEGMYVIYKEGIAPIIVHGSFPGYLVEKLLPNVFDHLVVVSTYSKTIKIFRRLISKFNNNKTYISRSEFKY